jgi:glycosyltransferase involved in cell wall biosynthesis
LILGDNQHRLQAVDILYVGFVLGHGGDAQQMLELASGVAARGARVQLVVPRLETTQGFAELSRERGLSVVCTPWVQASMDGVPQRPLDMVRLFHTYRAPIVHLHTGDCCIPRTAMLAMRLLRIPRAFATVHGQVYDTVKPGERRARAWARAAEHQLHRVICPSHHSRRGQIRLGVPDERIRVIYNGVDVRRFGNANPKVVRDSLQLAEDTPLIVFSSRLDQGKRPLDAVHAVARVAAEFPRVEMAMLGRGTLEGDLRAAVSQLGLGGRVHFVGYQDNVQDWLAAATIWVLPTEIENFSLAVLEAMAAGCAILSTMCPGNDEILVNGENALTTDVGDVDAMAAGLQRLLGDAGLRLRLSGNARAAAQVHSAEAMVNAYTDCYASS